MIKNKIFKFNLNITYFYFFYFILFITFGSIYLYKYYINNESFYCSQHINNCNE